MWSSQVALSHVFGWWKELEDLGINQYAQEKNVQKLQKDSNQYGNIGASCYKSMSAKSVVEN